MLLAALAAGGCEGWRSVKVDHPVLGPPPPRLSYEESPQSVVVAEASGSSPAGYVKVGLSQPGPISDHAVIAIVNGEPILAGQLLAPYRPYIVQAEAKGAPGWQVEQLKKTALERQLEQQIDYTLLVQSLKLMLKAEQLKQIDEQLDKEFEKETQAIMARHKVNSKAELEQVLGSEALFEYRQAFRTRQLAQLYLSEKVGGRLPVIGRREILDYYHGNLDKYEHPARAQFQLLMVTFKGPGKDRATAERTLDAALAALEKGAAFADVAKQYSDGPNADRGGQWDWLKPGEFADRNVDRALFELPVGQVSQVFETSNAFVVVKVTDREPAGRTPLAEVQDDIRHTLLETAQQSATKQLLEDLRKNAVITTYLE